MTKCWCLVKPVLGEWLDICTYHYPFITGSIKACCNINFAVFGLSLVILSYFQIAIGQIQNCFRIYKIFTCKTPDTNLNLFWATISSKTLSWHYNLYTCSSRVLCSKNRYIIHRQHLWQKLMSDYVLIILLPKIHHLSIWCLYKL